MPASRMAADAARSGISRASWSAPTSRAKQETAPSAPLTFFPRRCDKHSTRTSRPSSTSDANVLRVARLDAPLLQQRSASEEQAEAEDAADHGHHIRHNFEGHLLPPLMSNAAPLRGPSWSGALPIGIEPAQRIRHGVRGALQGARRAAAARVRHPVEDVAREGRPEDDDRAIGELGFTLGYESESAFSMALRREVGGSPRAYRQRRSSE